MLRRLVSSTTIAVVVLGTVGLMGDAVATESAARPPRVLGSPTVVRPSSDLHPELRNMHFGVEAFTGDHQTGQVRIQDAEGGIVIEDDLTHDCLQTSPCSPTRWDFTVQPYLSGSGGLLTPGRYTAVATVPDSDGRPVAVAFPAFTVQDRVEVHTHVWRRARKVDVPEASRTGRCTRLRQTGRPKGSVGLYSGVGCRTHRHRADVVSRIFRLRMPAADGDYERLDQVLSRLEYRRSGSRGQVRIQLRVPSIDPHWTDPHRVIRSGRRLWAGYADIRPDLHTDYRGAAMEVRVRAWGGARIDVLRVSAAPEYDVWR